MDNDSDDGESNSSHSKVITAKNEPSIFKTSAIGTLMRKLKGEKHAMTTSDVLGDLANALHAETLEHRFCWRLLRSVNERCRPQLLEMYGGSY